MAWASKRRRGAFDAPRSRGRAQGFSLPAVALAIAAMALLTMGITRQRLTATVVQSGESLGHTINEISSAIDNYRGSNLLTLTSASPSVTGFANPMAPTITELIAQGYLSTNMAAATGAGTIAINRMPPGCVGPSVTCNIWSQLSITTPFLEADGVTVSNTRLSAVLGAIKQSAGFSQRPDTSTITGGWGGWTVPNPDAAKRAGILVVVAGLGGTGTQWLHVGDPRDPAFTGNLTTAGYMKPSAGPSQTATAGTACTEPSGAIRNDTQGRVLSCQNGIWTAPDGGKSQVLQAPVNNVPGGTSFPVIACAPGGTPWASYSAQTTAINDTVLPPFEALVYSVSQSGGNWVTLTQAVKPPAAPVTVNTNSALLGIVPQGVFSSGCSYS